MGFPGDGERAEARRGGHLYSCATRERRIARLDSDANPRTDASIPNARLVRRWVAATTLHPDPGSNGPTGECIAEPFADRSDTTAERS